MADVAQGKTATASSTYSATYSPDKAVDGNSGTTWSPSSGPAPHWIHLDLGAAYTVDRFRCLFPSTGVRFNDFIVESSTDNASWTTRHTVTGNALADTGTVSLSSGAVTARYWRISVSAATGWPELATWELQE